MRRFEQVWKNGPDTDSKTRPTALTMAQRAGDCFSSVCPAKEQPNACKIGKFMLIY